MNILSRIGLAGQLLAIVLVVVSIDLLLNSWLFQNTQRYAMREEEAAAIAEHVVVANRLMGRTPPAERKAVARELTTERFEISWSRAGKAVSKTTELSTLHRQMLAAEPALVPMDLQLTLMPLPFGNDIGGSTQLRDASRVNFRFRSDAFWSLNFGRFLSMAGPSLAILALAWALLRLMLQPLRTLVRATSAVGASYPEPLEEAGQGEVLHLIRAFNAMQERIHQLLASGSQTLLAIGHDLRTPLARLQLRIDGVKIDPALRREIEEDIDEIRGLLQSLQTYVDSGHESGPPERIDIAVTAQTLVDNACDRNAQAAYYGPRHLEIMAHPVSIRRALSNLVENALAYAGNVRIEVIVRTGIVDIVVEDDGPGIPPERLAEALHPFIRFDDARTRNTAGMGLGLPIVDRVVQSEGGTLHLANKPSGGLRVTIRLPYKTGRRAMPQRNISLQSVPIQERPGP